MDRRKVYGKITCTAIDVRSAYGVRSGPMSLIQRQAAKVLLVTADADILLLSSLDPLRPDRGPYWFAVGGGVEKGESLEEAALREVHEETGLELVELGPVVLTRNASFDFEDDHYEQDESYFVAWVERFDPVADGWTDLERRAMSGHKWWSIGGLKQTEATVFPGDLAELIRSLTPERFTLRRATEYDSPVIQAIERRAGERFRDVGLPEIADDAPESAESLTRFARAGRSLVASDPDGDVVGYILVERVDDAAFVHQLSVLPEHQGQGIGRRLLGAVELWARQSGLPMVTLTTFDRHVAWNRPLYEHLGFRLLGDDELGPELRAISASESARGLRDRVAMVRPIHG
jgi:8-oxo-dGTP pyrophosphatase MutT (NUDIX family)/GNAT superfamily N-acetyltransferase